MEKLGVQARDDEFMPTCEMGLLVPFGLPMAKGVNFSSRTAGGNQSWKRSGWLWVLSPNG